MTLTQPQLAGLKCLASGPGDYFDLARVGVRGPTIHWLINQGFVMVDIKQGLKTYVITEAGRVKLADIQVAIP